ncbi:DUF3793 family protein [Candidatus Galacturonibacter soehngenii]|uniref:DUF3793 family protein n=1 Tax=Candidatus Galacturonatibacter soehngenii TaxID=2307010 RepID=A0A7V7QJJ2_9FIRM|nr:DUF3793 family protein [Candidatus Galacturonibacter soehngenii]KAB1437832.1 DUF3793 family protein [Candidatus Galacturonibacter soehngenii]MBA4687399.1 DUF3793 family protein [Candidatus Galacturonibacter soehngenii]
MSHEVFQLMKSMNLKKLEIQLAIQCAPVLTGIKISNLLIVHNENSKYVMELFQDTEISFFILCVTREKTTFLIYRSTELISYLAKPNVKELLYRLGYQNQDVQYFLHSLRDKYESYMKEGLSFPHELGLALGYPVEDVYGFIVNKGQNFLSIGYWKVYANVLEKQKLFDQYDLAKEMTIRFISNGVSILEIIEMYHKKKLQRVAF